MSINIEHEFDYAGGTLKVTLRDNWAYVEFTAKTQFGNESVAIEDASGGIADWHDLYGKEWACLSGAALRSAEKKFAENYAINSLGNYVLYAAEELANAEA